MRGGRRAKARRQAIMNKAQTNGHGVPVCTYCGARLSRKLEAFKATREEEVQFFTLDHIIPRCNNGVNDQRNLTAACRPCNEDRGDMPLDQFIESLGDKAVLSVEKAREMMREAEQVTMSVRFGR